MDINISANTLFHFTTSRQSLLGILANGLYVRYCLENYESLISGKAELVLPMTCFCDIPLSQVKRHTSTYGQYAIGLSKNWGMKNEVNPVIYTYPKSTTAKILDKLVDDLENFFDITEEETPNSKTKKTMLKKDSEIGSQYGEKVGELHKNLSHFIKFIKPYEGKFYRNDRYLDKPVKFYEEREWRFMPPKDFFDKVFLKDSYKSEYYKDVVKRRAIYINLAKHIKLNFNANDIRFIIVNKDDEIPGLLRDIEKIFGGNTPYNDLKLLGTRLISLEQILEDL
jgi:hypothetical protein